MDFWPRFNQQFLRYTDLGISLDVSKMGFPEGYLKSKAADCQRAADYMRELEAGEEKNVDEGRMVGHYWLRDVSRAPERDAGGQPVRSYIDDCREAIASFAEEIHGEGKFTHVLLIGIGGSALGPQLVADALGQPDDKMRVAFLDNTDPDGFERVLGQLPLASTLTLVISKSGGTKETANGMKTAQAAYAAQGLSFAGHAVAVTGVDSALDRVARGEEGDDEGRAWLRRFAMTNWVGGRTSVTSVVGLLPMALQGLDFRAFLDGAKAMDARTRGADPAENAAMMMALMWHHAGGGTGKRDMVILPYKDRLALMAKYLQQLIMESLGKARDLDGTAVEQGIAVYGNKGSTDQHAYVQQLRDGVDNFFATFIEVRENFGNGRRGESESGDYLQGFLRGTRRALADKGRPSMTLSLARIDAYTLGALIALYERAVGIYAVLVNINAYDQPGVEAGKKAAEAFICFLHQCRKRLEDASGEKVRAVDVHAGIEDYVSAKGDSQSPTIEDVYHALVHMAHNDAGVIQEWGSFPEEDTFAYQG